MPNLHLFEGFGVELEYMIVDSSTLKVLPRSDQVLKTLAGNFADEVENGPISWSNELALHVLEFKTNGPKPHLNELSELFAQNVRQVNAILAPEGASLLPTAMHPFMDPFAEMKLWPHEKNEIYEKYNAIFDCRGHGWANLQSVHLNLPFASDEEFGRLHAAIRVLLPILPAIAASSPVIEGHFTGIKDTRLNVYQKNQVKIPSITGKVIPEPVFSRKDYQTQILEKNYRDIAPYDPKGILQDEWLNSRGAIARFQRNTIEIRVLDIQECPAADLAILQVIVAVLKNLVNEKWSSLQSLKQWPVDPLFAIFNQCVEKGEEALIALPSYPEIFGLNKSSIKARELWSHLIKNTDGLGEGDQKILEMILEQGSLASRISKALGPDIKQEELLEIYRHLGNCLQENILFEP